jgi:hypothetical protein
MLVKEFAIASYRSPPSTSLPKMDAAGKRAWRSSTQTSTLRKCKVWTSCFLPASRADASFSACLATLIILPWEEFPVLFDHLEDEMTLRSVGLLAAPPDFASSATI